MPVPTCTTILTISNWIGLGSNCIGTSFSIWDMVIHTFTIAQALLRRKQIPLETPHTVEIWRCFEKRCSISRSCSNLHHNLDHIKLNYSWFKLHWDIILYMGYGNTHISYWLSLVANKTDTLRNITSSRVLIFVFDDKRAISHACSDLHHNLDHIKLNWSWFTLHWDKILYMRHSKSHIYYRLSLVVNKTGTLMNTISS